MKEHSRYQAPRLGNVHRVWQRGAQALKYVPIDRAESKKAAEATAHGHGAAHTNREQKADYVNDDAETEDAVRCGGRRRHQAAERLARGR